MVNPRDIAGERTKKKKKKNRTPPSPSLSLSHCLPLLPAYCPNLFLCPFALFQLDTTVLNIPEYLYRNMFHLSPIHLLFTLLESPSRLFAQAPHLISSLPPPSLVPPRWPRSKASASRAKDPGFESRLRQDCFGVES